jgi:hypothetical protein
VSHRNFLRKFATFVFLVLCICIAASSFTDEKSAEVLVVSGATIYSSPDESPISAGVIVLRNGKIEAVGSKEQTPIPPPMQQF